MKCRCRYPGPEGRAGASTEQGPGGTEQPPQDHGVGDAECEETSAAVGDPPKHQPPGVMSPVCLKTTARTLR